MDDKNYSIFPDNENEFNYINENFSIDDRDALIRLSGSQDNYYPNSKERVLKTSKIYKENKNLIVIFDRVNVVSPKGLYVLDETFNAQYDESTKEIDDENLNKVLFGLFNPNCKVRGAIYFKGVNIAQKSIKNNILFFNTWVVNHIDSSVVEEIKKVMSEPISSDFSFDKKSKMLKYYPTHDKNGRKTLLSVVDSSITFKVGRSEVKATQGASFDIYEGETFGLVGESGSGKTTISRAILRINKLSSGGIYFNGNLISSKLDSKKAKAVKKNIQMVFQDPTASLNERANVDYIVSEGLYNFHMFKNEEERVKKVVEMLEKVGLLPEHLSRYPHEFSGGQRQRIGIARALIIEPKLVLADEPISALDVSIRAQVLNLFIKLQKERNLTYLFIAHDLSIIRYISDRIAVMHKGHIVELGTAEEIYQNPLHPYTKSLLTAIPQPDPKSKGTRKKIKYNQGNMKYEECLWEEMKPGHFVLVNDELREQISSKLAGSINER